MKKTNVLFIPFIVIPSIIIGINCINVTAAEQQDSIDYEPTWESLEKHKMPEWYDDAKFGIFIHWGLYSVPAWAPRGEYAEWYPAYMQDPNNPTYQYHKDTYGEDFEYEDFIPMWKAENWEPEEWASLFDKAGAKYIVPVAEHHDGFPLWDSDITNWNANEMGPERDIIGELGEAVRDKDMKYGPSYHALLNNYTPEYSGPHPDFFSAEYVDFMNKKLKELIDKYQPDLMWLDGDWDHTPEEFKTKEMMAYYYNQAQNWDKEVVVNDRLGEVRGERGDFYTQEYEYDTIDELIDHKWENTRGIANSFGYNQNEPLEDYMSIGEVVETLVDNVSKNGNLLLDVGPKADGSIPDTQKEILLGVGEWLDINGEAIYETRPFIKAEDKVDGNEVRYTTKDQSLYATMFDWPDEEQIKLNIAPYIKTSKDTKIEMLGVEEALDWEVSGDKLIVKMPEDRPTTDQAYTLKFKAETGSESMKNIVNSLHEDGEITSEEDAHSLSVHLSAISHYEDKGAPDKIVKHLESFKQLLTHQKDNDLISGKAYEDLKDYSNYLLDK